MYEMTVSAVNDCNSHLLKFQEKTSIFLKGCSFNRGQLRLINKQAKPQVKGCQAPVCR